MVRKAARKRAPTRVDIVAYQHDRRRVNNPEVGMVDPDLDPGEDANRWRYDAHIDTATVSLSFEAGENRKVAVKIVDDRGIESLEVIPLE